MLNRRQKTPLERWKLVPSHNEELEELFFGESGLKKAQLTWIAKGVS
jgi:hypothetical protein